MRSLFLCPLFTLILFQSALSQAEKPDIFLDCQMYCHINYVKEQITFVNYMQDRQVADIYILATWQRTGAGGSEVQLVFEGNNHFAGNLDTIQYVVDPNATESIERDLLIKELKKGLLKYIVKTDMLDMLTYSVEQSENENAVSAEIDPWDYWVFNVGGYGWASGEQTYKRFDVTGNVSATRITDKEKFEFSARYNYEENDYTLSDGEQFKSIFKSYNLYLEYVKSLSPHWSLGLISRTGSSTFGNTDFNANIRAALEYNVFPYSEAQTRRFSFFYSLGPEYYDYTEPTIYSKQNEWATRHSLTVRYVQKQKWGQLYLTLGVQQYFHNLELYNAYINPWLEWQIFKGFSITFGGSVSFVNDRINIAKSSISNEDILLQIRQQDTDFTYYTHFGINYRFGSQYNNFVNPRF